MSENLNAEKETVDSAAELDQTNETSQEGEGQSQQEVVSRVEFEKIKKQLEQAEYTIEKVKKQKEQAPAASVSSQGSDDVVARIREERASEYLEDTLEVLSTDPVERERILDEYNSSIVKSGLTKQSIKNDLLKAAKLVRSDFNEKTAREAALSRETKQSIANAGGTSNQDKPQPQENWKRFLTSHDLKYMVDHKWPEERMKNAAMNVKNSLAR